MASTLQQQNKALLDNAIKQRDNAIKQVELFDSIIASLSPEGKEVETKKTDDKKPIQKLTEQLEEQQSKLTKLNEKIAGGKSKIPDKDEENKTKLEKKISEIQTKISELIAKESAPKPEKKGKTPKTEAKAEAPKTEAKAEAKHIPKITNPIIKKLKDAFETVGAPWDDKYKKEFVDYVNSLSEEDFAAYGLEGHMSKFANTHAPSAAGGGGGGGGPSTKSLTVAKLHEMNEHLNEMSAGVYQHKTTKNVFSGPEEDSDEDFEDVEVDDVDYVVGQTTKRVYKPQKDGPDVFVGYWGVGKFYDASL
jgi:TolA-binding protein